MRVQALLLVAFLGWIDGAAAAPSYFRSDLGLAKEAKKLPADLSLPSNLAWSVEIDPGHSTPIVAAGNLYFTTSSSDQLATVCLDADKGALLWRRVVPVPRVEEFHPQEGNAAMATPASDGERIFVFFGSHGLICYDLEGQVLWEKRLGPFRDEYGAASSPIVVDDKVILSEDHDIDSFVVAFDRRSGRELWKTSRPGAVRSYSTPAVWNHEGRKELLVAGALELAGYDLGSGEKLWWMSGLARIVIPTPLPDGDTIYMASWAPGGDPGQRLALPPWDQAIARWDKNQDGQLAKEEINDPEVISRFFRMDLNQNQRLDQNEWEQHARVFSRAQNALLAVKPKGRGAIGENAVAWKYQRGAPYVSSPVLHGGTVWMVKDGGLVTKIDGTSGELLQQERLGATGNYYASPVIGDGKVYFASVNGVVTVAADEHAWRLLSSHNFKEKIFATPLIQGDRLYVRTEKRLYCYRAKE